MFTKEELLQKGITEDAADEIISAWSEDIENSDDSLAVLEKALNDPEMDDLNKADKGEVKDEDEDDNEYDEKFMKKMKKYMKENKMCGDKMTKAIDEVDLDSDMAVVETSELVPFLESQKEFGESLVKAIEEINKNIEIVSDKADKSYDLAQKSAKVQVEMAKAKDSFLSESQGRKGVSNTTPTEQDVKVDVNSEIHSKLMKAVKNGVDGSGQAISIFESNGHDINKLNKAQRGFINDIIVKEAK